MASLPKNHLSGGKYSRSHTTVIAPARALCKIAESCQHVKGIATGFIKGELKGNCSWLVKIIDDGGSLLLIVKGDKLYQKIRLYVTDTEGAISAILLGVKKQNIQVEIVRKAVPTENH